MFNIILYRPEIPQNTGNIMRLCANTNTTLHIIKPIKFFINNKTLARAGMDYVKLTDFKIYTNLDECLLKNKFNNIYCFTTKTSDSYFSKQYLPHDAFMFGPESLGLPSEILSNPDFTNVVIPHKTQGRSLNLSNCAAISIYEAIRQNIEIF